MHHLSRRRWLCAAAAHAGLSGILGCGTVLHPERRGQAAGPLDWKIVALDGIGLLLFFVPGVIAFAVDFSTGAIYLPEAGYSEKRSSRKKSLVTRQIPKDSLTVAEVEQIVTDHVGEAIRLRSGTFQTEPLNRIDEFWTAVDKLADT